MNRSIKIASRLREVLLNGNWIANTNFKEQLNSINWYQAIQKVGSLNTIADLTYHLNYYMAGLIKAIETGNLEMSDKFSFNLPPITSEFEWNNLVVDSLCNSEKITNKVEHFNEAQLDQIFFNEKYGTWLRNIEGVIEHSYYHLGQVSLIKK